MSVINNIVIGCLPGGPAYDLRTSNGGGGTYTNIAFSNNIKTGGFVASPTSVTLATDAQDNNRPYSYSTSAKITLYADEVSTLTKLLTTAASATGSAGLNLPAGSAPSSPNDGDIWYDGTNVKIRVGGTTKTFTITP